MEIREMRRAFAVSMGVVLLSAVFLCGTSQEAEARGFERPRSGITINSGRASITFTDQGVWVSTPNMRYGNAYPYGRHDRYYRHNRYNGYNNYAPSRRYMPHRRPRFQQQRYRQRYQRHNNFYIPW